MQSRSPQAEEKVEFAVLRKRWREHWLSSIRELADIITQRSTWLNPKSTNVHLTFVEYVNSYFDMMYDDFGMCVSEGFLSQQEADAAFEFHDLLRNYTAPKNNDFDDRAILADSAWQAVVASAAATCYRLEQIITEPAERKALLEVSVEAQPAAT